MEKRKQLEDEQFDVENEDSKSSDRVLTVGPERKFAQITVERIARNLLDYNVLISNFDNYSSN